ncbi:MAG: hypothetical protein KDK30_09060 [Leptospiraceae bacterium]|nr:hypothetical protein [Leptospiraceae bacterium]MCB1319602.1 hypothetical protein [Leptospiraceae bacterium]
MNNEKAISMPVKEIAHMKVILATWYSFLRERMDELSKEDFTRYLKTPVIYDLENDQIELLFTGTEDLLQKFKDHVFKT